MASLRTLFANEPPDRPQQPSDDRVLRLAAHPSAQRDPLASINVVTPCDRAVLVQRVGSFLNFVPVCTTHRWVGDVVGSEWAAVRQICEAGLHQRIYAARASALQGRQFTRFTEGE